MKDIDKINEELSKILGVSIYFEILYDQLPKEMAIKILKKIEKELEEKGKL